MNETVFVDIDTQFDFLYPSGALYGPGAERLIPALAQLNRYAAAHGIPVISSMDAHAENDPEFRQWPAHCVAGTLGQRKPATMLLERVAIVSSVPARHEIDGAQQIVIEKQTLDLFTNPNLPAVLESLDAARYVVYGVFIEYCVRCAVMGLVRTGKHVELVTDAIDTLRHEDARNTLEEFAAAGGRLTTVRGVASRA